MKILEDILKGVTPQDWHESHSSAPDWNGDWYIMDAKGNVLLMGEGWDASSQANARFTIRAARNFAPMVRALQEIADAPSLTSRYTLKQIARKVLAQALDDEP